MNSEVVENRAKFLVIASAAFLILCGIQIVFHDALFTMSVQLSAFLQNGETFLDFWVELFGYLISESVYVAFIGLFALSLHSSRKHLFVYVTIVSSVGIGLLSLVKNVFHDPRPYMVSDEIRSLDCDSEYGFPSGHTFMSVLFFYLIESQFLREPGPLLNTKQQEKEKEMNLQSEGPIRPKHSSFVKKMIESNQSYLLEKPAPGKPRSQLVSAKNMTIFYGIAIGATFLVMLARIICGAHTFMQVIAGAIFGLIFALLVEIYFEMVFFDTITNLHQLRVLFRTKISFYFWAILITYAGLSVIVMIFNLTYVDAAEWVARIDKCLPYFDKNGTYVNVEVGYTNSLMGKCLIDSGYLFIGLFLLFIPINTSYNAHYTETREITKNEWTMADNIKRGLMTAVCLLIATVFIALKPIFTESWVTSFIIQVISGFWFAFVWEIGLPYAFRYANLDWTGDFLKLDSQYLTY